jgi:hypothetical protein
MEAIPHYVFIMQKEQCSGSVWLEIGILHMITSDITSRKGLPEVYLGLPGLI